MCIRDRADSVEAMHILRRLGGADVVQPELEGSVAMLRHAPVSYTHLRAHETVLDLVCRLLLEKKKDTKKTLQLVNHRDTPLIT